MGEELPVSELPMGVRRVSAGPLDGRSDRLERGNDSTLQSTHRAFEAGWRRLFGKSIATNYQSSRTKAAPRRLSVGPSTSYVQVVPRDAGALSMCTARGRLQMTCATAACTWHGSCESGCTGDREMRRDSRVIWSSGSRCCDFCEEHSVRRGCRVWVMSWDHRQRV